MHNVSQPLAFWVLRIFGIVTHCVLEVLKRIAFFGYRAAWLGTSGQTSCWRKGQHMGMWVRRGRALADWFLLGSPNDMHQQLHQNWCQSPKSGHWHHTYKKRKKVSENFCLTNFCIHFVRTNKGGFTIKNHLGKKLLHGLLRHNKGVYKEAQTGCRS